MRLLPPVRFRMGEPDRDRYGDEWITFDEAALLRVPSRQLVDIERQVGMGLPAMLAWSHDPASPRYTEATLAVTWTARRLSGADEPYDGWEPLVHLIEWERIPGGDVNPPDLTSSDSPESAGE